METRRFGRTGHLSTVAIFGAFSLAQVDQPTADQALERVIEAGVNHIDVAPSYGAAEDRLRPWMARERDRFFLGCKTFERSRAAAAAELHQSLKRLGVDHFDLYQIHAITTFEELEAVTRPGGALEALVEAREAGLVRHLGITGHGLLTPAVFLEALRRFDFDSVLFPLNFVQFTHADYRRSAEALLKECRARDVGTMIIKSIARGPWGDKYHTTYTVGYSPWDQPEQMQSAVNYVLSHDVTGLCTVGDTRLLPLVLRACEKFTPLSPEAREALVAYAAEQKLFHLPLPE
jgi:aryl-alcohol dehydrogenase-like predicted oxidoreductase